MPSAPERLPVAVLFDWDGTLADTFAATRSASLAVFRHFGVVMDDARYRDTYRPDWHQTYRELGIPEDRWEEAGEVWRARYLEGSAGLRLLPGAARVLDDLDAAGMLTGVVTSADRERFRSDLARLGLGERFRALVAFEDAIRKKPHPEGLRLALRRLGASPERVLYVGDRPEDIEMGRRGGVRTAAVVSAFSDEAMLRAAEPDLFLDSIRDLPAAIGA